MYESVFQFRERPFCWAPRTDLYYPASAIETAYQTLVRCVDRAEGPSMLIGGPGTGKSLVCHRLAEQFRDAFHVALLNSAQLCTRRALLQNLLFELGLPYRGLEEGELRLALIDFLDPTRSTRSGMLLLVDEAHTLPLRLLEELRMITNLVRNGQPRVRLVLAGGPILEERFASPKLECFNQRIAARCYLQPLSFEETCQYIRSQIAAVGGNPDQLFTADALQAVHQATTGIPRLINQVCDHALMLAAVGQQGRLDAAGVQEAWADLQQLPTPWQASVRDTTAPDNVIEFGTLEEFPEEDTSLEPPASSPPASAAEAEPNAPRERIDLMQQLDALQLQVAELEENLPSAPTVSPAPVPVESRPVSAALDPAGVGRGPADAAPPAEPVVPAAGPPLPEVEDPFGAGFEHEEPVVDRYAALDAANLLASRTRAARPESPDPASPDATPVPAVTVHADAAGGDPDEEHDVRAQAPAKVLRVLPPDDTDLIVIVEPEPGATRPLSAVGRPQRQEYRQLFSQLRQT